MEREPEAAVKSCCKWCFSNVSLQGCSRAASCDASSCGASWNNSFILKAAVKVTDSDRDSSKDPWSKRTSEMDTNSALDPLERQKLMLPHPHANMYGVCRRGEILQVKCKLFTGDSKIFRNNLFFFQSRACTLNVLPWWRIIGSSNCNILSK